MLLLNNLKALSKLNDIKADKLQLLKQRILVCRNKE